MSKREGTMPGKGIPQKIYALARCLERRLSPLFRGTGLHWGLRRILQRLWLGDGLSQSELARAIHFSEASISNMLKHLVNGGWVERRIDAYDYRITRVFLTQKGIDLRTAVEAELGAVDRDLREILPANEYTKLAALLDRSLDCLEGSLECGAMHEGHPTGIYDREGPPGNA